MSHVMKQLISHYSTHTPSVYVVCKNGGYLKTPRGKDWTHERVRDLRNETDLEVQRLYSSSDVLGGLLYKRMSI